MSYPLVLRNGIKNSLAYTGQGMKATNPEVCRPVPSFNGADQYVSIPTLSVIPSYTVKFKINPSSVGAIDSVIENDGPTSNYIQYRNDGRLRARIEDSVGGIYTRSSFALSVGTTYEVEVIITPTTLGMMIDGVSQGTTNLANPQDPATTYSSLGIGEGGRRALNAKLWDVEILGAVFPLDDGWSNNPTARNTGVGGDGTFMNMTEAAWTEVCE